MGQSRPSPTEPLTIEKDQLVPALQLVLAPLGPGMAWHWIDHPADFERANCRRARRSVAVQRCFSRQVSAML